MTSRTKLNVEHVIRDVILIGGSAGSFQIVRGLLSRLPQTFGGIVGIVIHRSPHYLGTMAPLFQLRSPLEVTEPAQGTIVKAGAVYLAPADVHMRFDAGRIAIDRGAKEHYTRPAIDPLFRSGAIAYGPRVLGVLLSGYGGDGTSGLAMIKEHSGKTIVQSPEDAQYPPMPRNAIVNDDVDAVLSMDDIARAILVLIEGRELDVASDSSKT